MYLASWSAYRDDDSLIYRGRCFVKRREDIQQILRFYREGHPSVKTVEVRVYDLVHVEDLSLPCDLSTRDTWEDRRWKLERLDDDYGDALAPHRKEKP